MLPRKEQKDDLNKYGILGESRVDEGNIAIKFISREESFIITFTKDGFKTELLWFSK